jgi:hypothetical protein
VRQGPITNSRAQRPRARPPRRSTSYGFLRTFPSPKQRQVPLQLTYRSVAVLSTPVEVARSSARSNAPNTASRTAGLRRAIEGPLPCQASLSTASGAEVPRRDNQRGVPGEFGVKGNDRAPCPTKRCPRGRAHGDAITGREAAQAAERPSSPSAAFGF